ncbi:hypothetical protein QVD17_22750 [Tagetes erecta]|uniref:eRF1/Pelota-like N-terminal domain-containing protein n=1 Tax=Tagetes erecta TaxID=13708 RepID=A0AAD8KFV3_TARER|nr:hypothetical protein QVD17_22750 [Tagetes erecta]
MSDDQDENVKIWKMKKAIKELEAAKGKAKTMISLIIPPDVETSHVARKLHDDYRTTSRNSSNMSIVTRRYVLSAISSARIRVLCYNGFPPNGLVLYMGIILTDEGKHKCVAIEFEPFKPINFHLYRLDDKFHTEALNEFVDKFGSIFMDEKYILGKYFEKLVLHNKKCVIGVDDTLKFLNMGVVETLFVSENLDIERYVLKNSTTGAIVVKHLKKDQEADGSNFRDSDTNVELQVEEKMSLVEWLVNEYKKIRCKLEFVTNKSQEGSQFCKRFGGVVGILRFPLNIRSFDDVSDESEISRSD